MQRKTEGQKRKVATQERPRNVNENKTTPTRKQNNETLTRTTMKEREASL